MLRHRQISALLLSFALATVPSIVFADKAKEEQRLNAVVNRIQALQQSLGKLARQQDQQNASLRQIEVEAASLRKQIETTSKKLQTLQQERGTLKQQQDKLQASRQQQAKLMAEHIQAAYRLGREEQLKLLLNEEDPARFNRMLKYHDYFITARSEKVNTYLKTLDDLADVEQAITVNEQQLIISKTQLESQQQNLNKQRSQRKTELAKLNQQITSDQQQLDKLLAERKALEAIIRELEQAIVNLALPSSAQPFAKRKGAMSWPASGSLRYRFGNLRKADIRWQGWLLSAKEGAAVNAVHNGRVVFSDYLRGHGLLLIIDHGDGYMSLYAHNQVLLKEAGDWVQSGETIAKVGDSGGLEETALYFEIRKDGKPQNPANWLKKTR